MTAALQTSMLYLVCALHHRGDADDAQFTEEETEAEQVTKESACHIYLFQMMNKAVPPSNGWPGGRREVPKRLEILVCPGT